MLTTYWTPTAWQNYSASPTATRSASINTGTPTCRAPYASSVTGAPSSGSGLRSRAGEPIGNGQQNRARLLTLMQTTAEATRASPDRLRSFDL